jgi:CelD/BcsL family acetyltransferase involved in cellulose biosynthesis
LNGKHEIYPEPKSTDGSRVYELDPLADARWSEFVTAHPRASVFHSRSWLRALQGAYGYQPFVLTTARPNERLRCGLVFCRINSWLTGKRIVSLPFSDHCEPLVDTQEDLDAMLGHVRHAISRINRYIELRPIVAGPSPSTGLTISDTYFFHTIPLSGSTEALFQTFHKDCVQRKIRRAERESLSYESGNSEDLLDKFYRLLVMTRRRQYNPPQPISWFQNLSRAFGNGLQVRLASLNGRPVASILTLKHGSTITYKYGCSDLGSSNLGGTAMLFWKTIQESAQEGMVEFDLGRSSVDNEGLISFKERWGARRATLHYWRFPYSRKADGSVWKTNLKKRLVAAAPEWCLTAAGNLLYPHIG